MPSSMVVIQQKHKSNKPVQMWKPNGEVRNQFREKWLQLLWTDRPENEI